MTSLRQRFIEDMQIRNLAVNTQDSYVQQVSRFARHFNKSPELLGREQIRAYQVYLTNERKLATGSILIAISALRFLYFANNQSLLRQAHHKQVHKPPSGPLFGAVPGFENGWITMEGRLTSCSQGMIRHKKEERFGIK
jgi:site-specific recombinase XerD